MDFFKVAAFILKQVLSHHFVLLKTWGLQVLYYYRRNIFKFSIWANQIDPASPIIMTLWLQPGVINNHEPALATIMNRHWQQSWPGIISFYNPTMVVIINRRVLHLQAGWISVEYLKTNIFVKSEDWRPIQMDSLFTKYLLQANWLWRWLLTRIFQKEEMTRT